MRTGRLNGNAGVISWGAVPHDRAPGPHADGSASRRALQFAHFVVAVDGPAERAQAVYDVLFLEPDRLRRLPYSHSYVSGNFSRSKPFKMITPSPESLGPFRDIPHHIVE